MKRQIAPIIFCILFWACTGRAAGAGVTEITVTSPWLALLVNFIGGVNVRVNPIQNWNDDGELVRRIRARNLQTLNQEALIMAFDYRDAMSVGLPYEQYKNYRSLYEPMPLDENKLDIHLSDPSIIPFVAQRVLTALAYWDPDNYLYYQRRLAEFQTRLYSTVLAGRQILKDQPVYDLTGHSAPLLQAVGCRLTRPTADEWAAWSAWKDASLLTAVVSRMAAEKIPVIIDHSTPKAIRGMLRSNPAVFLFSRPKSDQDYPAFLNDQYISLWTRITSRPLPPLPRRR